MGETVRGTLPFLSPNFSISNDATPLNNFSFIIVFMDALRGRPGAGSWMDTRLARQAGRPMSVCPTNNTAFDGDYNLQPSALPGRSKPFLKPFDIKINFDKTLKNKHPDIYI